jgi:hypothetical protein
MTGGKISTSFESNSFQTFGTSDSKETTNISKNDELESLKQKNNITMNTKIKFPTYSDKLIENNQDIYTTELINIVNLQKTIKINDNPVIFNGIVYYEIDGVDVSYEEFYKNEKVLKIVGNNSDNIDDNGKTEINLSEQLYKSIYYSLNNKMNVNNKPNTKLIDCIFLLFNRYISDENIEDVPFTIDVDYMNMLLSYYKINFEKLVKHEKDEEEEEEYKFNNKTIYYFEYLYQYQSLTTLQKYLLKII